MVSTASLYQPLLNIMMPAKKTFLALELSKSPLKRFVHLSVNRKDEDAHFAICVGHSLVYECYLKLPVGLWKRAASSNIKKSA